jgi:hypothetical protein
MPKVCDVMPVAAGGQPLTDDQMHTSCPGCGLSQSLDQATLNETDPLETIYCCMGCQAPILIVSTPGVVPWQGRGYRLGDWSIRNPNDLHVLQSGSAEVLLPASANALD